MSAGKSECTAHHQSSSADAVSADDQSSSADAVSADDQSLSADAVPSSPRQLLDENAQDESEYQQPVTDPRQQQPATGNRQQVIPDPPTDWEFNVFLNQLSESLTTEDLGTMKFFFEGDGGIGKGTLEKIKTPLELFRILRSRKYVSRDNLLYIQAVLFHSGRKDLVSKAVEYSRTIGNVLHFYVPSFLPENGYRYVRFHVDGHDFKTYSRRDVEILRSRIMKLLFVPEQFIIISGIEPASSLVVTLMIPDMYVSILQELLEDGENILDIGDLGVDIVEIQGQIYNIKGATAVEEAKTEQQAKLVNVYDQLQQSSKLLDDSEVERIELYRQNDDLQSKLNEAEVGLSVTENQLNTIKKVVSMSSDEPKPATLKELSSLKEFTESLQQVNMDATNRNVIQRMLSATISIVSTRVKESHRIQEQKLMLELQDMQSKLEPLMFDLNRYMFFTGINTSNIEKSIQDSIQKLLQAIKVPQAQVQQTLTDLGLQWLKKISSKLRFREKEKLKQHYEWSAEGTIEKYMEQDPTLFLAGLFYKEIEKTRNHVQFVSFIEKCLTEVSRGELMKYLEIKPRYAEAKQTKEPQQGQQQQQEQTQGIQQQQQQQQQQEQYDIIKIMAKQMEVMHSFIQTKQEQYASKRNDWKSSSFPFEQSTFFQSQHAY